MFVNFILLMFFIYSTYQGIKLMYENRTRFKYLTNSYVDFYQMVDETENKSKSEKRLAFGIIVASYILLITFMIDIWAYDTSIIFTILTIIQILTIFKGLRHTYGIYFIEEEKESYSEKIKSKFRYIFNMSIQFISIIYCFYACVTLFLQLIK